MAGPIYVIGGYQTDFGANWARNGRELADGIREVLEQGLARDAEASLKAAVATWNRAIRIDDEDLPVVVDVTFVREFEASGAKALPQRRGGRPAWRPRA